MTRTCHRGTMGMAISILASLVLTLAGAAEEEAPSRRHVSPRLIVKVPRGSMDGLDSVTYGPAGQLVVSGQWDGQVRVHDPVTGKELRRIDVGPSHSAWVAFSPDGRRMVCAVGYAIREFPLVDFESGKILKTFEGQGHGSRLAVFSPDGRQILTSHAGLWNYNKSEVVCWDAASGERIQQFSWGPKSRCIVPDSAPMANAFSRLNDFGARMAPTAQVRRIWNVADGTLLHTLADPERFLEDAIFSPDGRERFSFLRGDRRAVGCPFREKAAQLRRAPSQDRVDRLQPGRETHAHRFG